MYIAKRILSNDFLKASFSTEEEQSVDNSVDETNNIFFCFTPPVMPHHSYLTNSLLYSQTCIKWSPSIKQSLTKVS